MLVDDFSGTGQTLVSGLRRELEFLQHVNSKGIRIVLIALVGFTDARTHVERFVVRNGLDAHVYFCDELGSEHRAFSNESLIFPDPSERDRARQIAEAKGVELDRKQALGFHDTAATVVFYQSCPNNTLPILWSRGGGWSPLFPRI